MGTVVVNNDIYLVGGRLKNTLYKYTYTTNTWSSLATLPGARFYPAVCTDGYNIYSYGGSTATTLSSYTNQLNKYNIATNTWSVVGNFGTRKRGCGAFYHEGRVYIVGGYNAENSTYSNDFFYIDLSTLEMVELDPFPIQVTSAALCVHEGVVYHFGGTTPSGLTDKFYKLVL
jgi:N-acetylneuraminic acid mutarotase